MSQVSVFEKQIEQLVGGAASEFPELRAMGVASKVIAELNRQLVRHSVERASEVFGPSLAILGSANLSSAEAEASFSLVDFDAVAECWYRGEEAKRNALNKQIEEATRLLLPQNIKSIEILDGDSHNAGFQPLLIKTGVENGAQEKLIYKSIDPAAYRIVEHISSFVCNGLGCAPLMEPIISETDGSYLRKFTESNNRLNQHQIANYFYMYGVMVSLASFLEIIDLHFENIVTTNDGPKIIDTEFVFVNAQSKRGKWSYKNSGLFEGITSPIGQHSAMSFIRPMFEQAEQELRYSFTRAEVREEHLIQDIAGNKINTVEYADIMQKGARHADEFIRHRSNEIRGLINLVQKSDHKIRCFVRGTAYYRILQLQMWAPNPPRLADRIAKTVQKLKARKSAPYRFRGEALDQIIEAELHDMLHMDIPYFWVNGADGSLNHHSGLRLQDYGRPTAEAFVKRMEMAPIRVSERKFRGLRI